MPYTKTALPKREHLNVRIEKASESKVQRFNIDAPKTIGSLIMPVKWWGSSGPTSYPRWEDDLFESVRTQWVFQACSDAGLDRTRIDVNYRHGPDTRQDEYGNLTIPELALFAEIALDRLGDTSELAQRLSTFAISRANAELELISNVVRPLQDAQKPLFMLS